MSVRVELAPDVPPNSGCKPITTACPGRLMVVSTQLPSDLVAMIFAAVSGTNIELPGSAAKPMVPSMDGLCNVWLACASKVNKGGNEPAVCTAGVATEVLLDVIVQLVSRLPG